MSVSKDRLFPRSSQQAVFTRIVSNRVELLPVIISMALVILIFSPVLAHQVTLNSDYGAHLSFIQHLLDEGDTAGFISTVPHFLFHIAVIAVYWLLSGIATLQNAAFMVALLLYKILFLVIYLMFRAYVGRPQTFLAVVFYSGFTLVLMLVMPVNFLTPEEPYLGYVATNVYHNPTMVVLKPLALLLFFLALNALRALSSRRISELLIYTGVTVLCIFAKPSYVVVFLPALVLVMVYRYWVKQPVNWFLLIGGIMIPASLILGLQTLLFDTSQIIFAPKAFFIAHSVDKLVPKFALSILFPVSVYLVYVRCALRSLALNLAWLTFGFGTFFVYFLAEANRVRHGNLTWSGQISLLVLFVVSALFFLDQNRELVFGRGKFRLSAGFIIILVVLGLHLYSGIFWYQYSL